MDGLAAVTGRWVEGRWVEDDPREWAEAAWQARMDRERRLADGWHNSTRPGPGEARHTGSDSGAHQDRRCGCGCEETASDSDDLALAPLMRAYARALGVAGVGHEPGWPP